MLTQLFGSTATVVLVFDHHFSNQIAPSTRADYGNAIAVLEDVRRRDEDRLREWLEDAKRWKCQAHRAPPIAVDLASSEREPGFPQSLEGRRPLLRHRLAGARARVPIRSRPGFRAAA